MAGNQFRASKRFRESNIRLLAWLADTHLADITRHVLKCGGSKMDVAITVLRISKATLLAFRAQESSKKPIKFDFHTDLHMYYLPWEQVKQSANLEGLLVMYGMALHLSAKLVEEGQDCHVIAIQLPGKLSDDIGDMYVTARKWTDMQKSLSD